MLISHKDEITNAEVKLHNMVISTNYERISFGKRQVLHEAYASF